MLHKSCCADSTLDSPGWTVQLNAYTVHVVPDRIMKRIESPIPQLSGSYYTTG